MMHELLIQGKQVDIGDVNIVLEYITNIFGDPGKVNFSRSYTISLPKTRRNSDILDSPGAPAHTSNKVRHYFTANYYRNGINLLGDAQAYILRTTEDAYEIALIWSALDALQELSQAKDTLNDLDDLPILRWIGANGLTPDYTGKDDKGGAVHAWYNSGLGRNTPASTNAATHPSMKVDALFDMIMDQAGISYSIKSQTAKDAMARQVILAAPSHKPTESMDEETGTAYEYARTAFFSFDLLYVDDEGNGDRTDGWDPVTNYNNAVTIGDEKSHRVFINLRVPDADRAAFADITLRVMGRETNSGSEEILASIPLDSKGYQLNEIIDVSGLSTYWLSFASSGALPNTEFSAATYGKPLVRFNKIHEEIIISKDNRFPLEGNLPEIGQWDFIKACMAMYGLIPIIKGNTLHFYGYDDLLDYAQAYDWTRKVDMTADGMPLEVCYTFDSWARNNLITFAESKGTTLNFDPDVAITVSDRTLKESREWAKIPLAASNGSEAPHYKKKDDGTVESIDIGARIFTMGVGANGGNQIYFANDMHGDGLKDAYYTKVQDVAHMPVRITANIRLHEIDLAQLDLSRPVYLGQFGRYYAIFKIQTSDTDLCKVELIQLP